MRTKILWISQLIVTAVLVTYALLSAFLFYDNLTAEQTEDLKQQASFFDESYSLDETGVKAFSEKLGGSRVTVIALDGAVLADSASGVGENHFAREEVTGALETGEGIAVRKSATLGKEAIYYCKKIVYDGEEVLVRISVATDTVWDIFLSSLPTLVWFFVVDFFICLLFTYLQTEYIIRPVKQIAKAAALNNKVETPYKELQPVVEILNMRNAQVSEKIAQLSMRKELVEKAQQSKNDFIANITHEMNTPLTSIRGYSELLLSGALDEAQTKQAAEILLSQSNRLSKLIARIINYNELDNDDLPSYEVNASELLQEILENLSPSFAKKQIKLTKEIEEGIVIRSRQERVNEVMGNLIRNAIRYNKEGGELSVSLQRTQKGIRFSVKDTGIGIAEENLERIFDRFFTVDKSHNGEGGGFGLGLAMVKKICNKSGWVIGVKSVLGEGTCFTVDIKE